MSIAYLPSEGGINKANIELVNIPLAGDIIVIPVKTAEGNSTVNVKVLSK